MTPWVDDPAAITPVQQCGPLWVKRDDLFVVGAMRGGKVRTCLHLAKEGLAKDRSRGLVTAGSRHSPQVAIVAAVARHLGIPCRAHVPTGELGDVVAWAQAQGCEIVQHRAGYNSVIKRRALDDSRASGWIHIPFGMECQEAVEQTRRQARSLPPGPQRVVVAAGSSMSLSGIRAGMADGGDHRPIVGVIVGADPLSRLDKYSPGWRWEGLFKAAGPQIGLVHSPVDYSKHVHGHLVTDDGETIDLDPVYEAKCLDVLRPGDLFWIVGHRDRAQRI